MVKTVNGIKQRLLDFLYNEDRALASLAGAPAQETISSEAGRLDHQEYWATVLCDVLNWIQPGHCQHAVIHADSLEKNDTGSG